MTDKITQVRIGKNLIGLRGLEEAFEEVRSRGQSPEQAQEELCRRVAAHNYIPAGSREEYRRALWREFRRFQGEEVAPETPAALEIKVLGLGCSGCRHFYQQVVEILAARSMAAELQYITDPALLRDYGIRTFPAMIINGRVAVAGKVPPAAELEKILAAAANR
ncbi:MAG: MTH895/ArsE family thioredoxin-like protein [Pseudomonadota bacterium]